MDTGEANEMMNGMCEDGGVNELSIYWVNIKTPEILP